MESRSALFDFSKPVFWSDQKRLPDGAGPLPALEGKSADKIGSGDKTWVESVHVKHTPAPRGPRICRAEKILKLPLISNLEKTLSVAG